VHSFCRGGQLVGGGVVGVTGGVVVVPGERVVVVVAQVGPGTQTPSNPPGAAVVPVDRQVQATLTRVWQSLRTLVRHCWLLHALQLAPPPPPPPPPPPVEQTPRPGIPVGVQTQSGLIRLHSSKLVPVAHSPRQILCSRQVPVRFPSLVPELLSNSQTQFTPSIFGHGLL
jgi:hypothetical protein